MAIAVRMLQADDGEVLSRVADDVFDFAIDPAATRAFLADPHHHIAVAIDDGLVVGFASGVDYLHPDKPPQLWVNEVGVAPSHKRRGIGRRVLQCLLEHGRTLGCREAWVGTEPDNAAARALYAHAGGSDPPETFVLYAFDLTHAAEAAADRAQETAHPGRDPRPRPRRT